MTWIRSLPPVRRPGARVPAVALAALIAVVLGTIIAGPCASWTPETGRVNSSASDVCAREADVNSVLRMNEGAGRGKGIVD